jgi:FtsP/CotA-like multicopper oxidase with cupredoxin domain
VLEFCEGQGGVLTYRLPGQLCEGIAPVMRMNAGTTYELVLKNDVPGTVTNIHTHGLHISGEGKSDDITRSKSTHTSLSTEYLSLGRRHCSKSLYMA